MGRMRNLRPVALAVLALFTTAGALAQAKYIPAQQRKGYSELDTLDIKSDIAYLASDKLEGRMSLQAGDDAAIQWLVGQFAKAGLDPVAIGASGLPSYLQKFDLIEYRPDRVNTSVTLLRKGKAVVWHAPQAFGAYKQAVDLTASVVFAGYGITARELDYDDYANIDAKGKIVLVFDHEPQEDDPHSIFNGTGNTRYATSRVKLLNAQAHGAVALIVIPEPNRKHLTNAERAARIGGSLARAVPIPQQAIADDELKIPLITMNDETARVLLSASAMTGSQLQAAKDLFPQSRDLADTRLTIHLVNSTERRATTANVVGLLRGSDNSLSAETVMISAHHDHDGEAPCPAGQGGIDENGQPTPAGKDCVDIWHGADDNASGTAGVLALARAFQVNKARPARSILFVIFASEERGLLGAFYMAQHPLRPLATTRAVINFDMIGRDEKPSPQTDGLIDIPADTTNRLNLIGAPYSPDYDATVREENQLINLTIDNRFDHDAVLNVLFRSDQFPFLLKNIPAFWWFTGFHPDYHHITDTVEKIDVPKMRKILQLAYLTAWRFGTSQPPAFVANPAAPAAAAAADAAPAVLPPASVTPVTLGPSAPAAAAAPAPPPAPPAGAEVIELKAAPPAPSPAATAAPVPATAPARLKSSAVPAAATTPPAGAEAIELKAAPPAPKPVPVGPAPTVTPVGLKSSIVPADTPPPALVADPDAVALKPAATDAPAAPANAIPLQPATIGAPTGAPVGKPAVTSVTLQPSANPNILAEPAPKTTYTPITLKPDAPPAVAPAKKAAKPAKVSIGSSVSAPVVINSSDGSAPPDTTTPPPHEED